MLAAVCIGVNLYEDPNIPDLKYAASDARRFATLLRSLGVDSERIHTLFNGDATRASILRLIRVGVLAKEPIPSTIVIYFAGHGANPRKRTRGGSKVLLPCDVKREDIEGTGITFADLADAIERIGAKDVCIFIDACFFDVDVTARINLVGDQERGLLDSIKSRSLLCLAAAPGAAASATPEAGGGLFTDALIGSLQRVQTSDKRSLPRLLEEVDISWAQHGDIPGLSQYLYGVNSEWPFPKTCNMPVLHETIIRVDAVAHFVDLLGSREGKAVWLVGKQRSGKTTLLRDLKRTIFPSIYVSSEVSSHPSHLLRDLLASSSLLQLGLDNRPHDANQDLDHALCDLIALVPNLTILLDHAERVPYALLEQLQRVISKASGRLMLASRLHPLIQTTWSVVSVPPLTAFEAGSMLTSFGVTTGIDSDILCRITENSFLEALNLVRIMKTESTEQPPGALSGWEELTDEQCIAAACLSYANGCFDTHLFAIHCRVNEESLLHLQRIGLAYRLDGLLIPHDVLKLRFPLDKSRKDGIDNAISYWLLEVASTQSTVKVQRLVDLLGDDVSFDLSLDRALAVGVSLLHRDQQWTYLARLAAWVKRNPTEWPDALLACLRMEADRADFAASTETRRRLLHCELSKEQRDREKVYAARALWWEGHFDEAEKLAKDLLGREVEQESRDGARLELGVVKFFRGDWEEARVELESVASRDPRQRGWVQMILGSIDALRGINLVVADQRMLNAIELLRAARDWVGVGIVWNNLGEARWKRGQYVEALEALEQADTIAHQGGNETDRAEICRNQLAASSRFYGAFSAEAEHLFGRLMALQPERFGKMQQMQIWNTVSTFHAYRREMELAQAALDRARAMTGDNKEYRIYSLGNEALLLLLKNRDSRHVLQKATALAREGDNRLAEAQVIQDFSYVQKQIDQLT